MSGNHIYKLMQNAMKLLYSLCFVYHHLQNLEPPHGKTMTLTVCNFPLNKWSISMTSVPYYQTAYICIGKEPSIKRKWENNLRTMKMMNDSMHFSLTSRNARIGLIVSCEWSSHYLSQLPRSFLVRKLQVKVVALLFKPEIRLRAK